MELKGKIIDFLGDSITEGYLVKDVERNRYDHVLKRISDLKETHNYGVGGTRFAHQFFPSETPRWDLSFISRARDMDPEANIIIVYGGVNDYYHGDAPFGKIGDMERTTFCGAVDYLIRFLRETYPQAVLVFLTPAHTINDAGPSKSIYKHVPGLPLYNYVEAIERIAAKYNIPVMNLFTQLGIDPNDPDDYEKYTADGLHLNDAGHIVLANKLKSFLESL